MIQAVWRRRGHCIHLVMFDYCLEGHELISALASWYCKALSLNFSAV